MLLEINYVIKISEIKINIIVIYSKYKTMNTAEYLIFSIIN